MTLRIIVTLLVVLAGVLMFGRTAEPAPPPPSSAEPPLAVARPLPKCGPPSVAVVSKGKGPLRLLIGRWRGILAGR